MSQRAAQATHSNRLRAALPALLGAAAAGALLLSAWLATAQPAAGQPLLPVDSALDVEPLLSGTPAEMKASWNEGTTPPYTFFVELTGLEELGGATYARRTWSLPGRRKRRTVMIDWLRPTPASGSEPARLLLGARTIYLEHQRIEPPLPLLVAPLEEGRSWSWEGRVGSFSAKATFRVLAPTRSDNGELVVRVEQETAVDSLEGPLVSKVVRGYRRGLGQVEEVGHFPLPHQADGVVGWREATPKE